MGEVNRKGAHRAFAQRIHQNDPDAEVDTALSVLHDLRLDSVTHVPPEDDHQSNYYPLSSSFPNRPEDERPTKNYHTPPFDSIRSVPPSPSRNDESYVGDASSHSERPVHWAGSTPVAPVLIDPPETFVGVGSYNFDSAENVDDYLKNLGVGLVFRKVQAAANPSLTIYPCKIDEWAIKTESIFRSREIKFKLGEEFSDETYDGRPCRTVATIEPPSRLILRQRCPLGPDVKMIYEFQSDGSINLALITSSSKAALRFIPNTEL